MVIKHKEGDNFTEVSAYSARCFYNYLISKTPKISPIQPCLIEYNRLVGVVEVAILQRS